MSDAIIFIAGGLVVAVLHLWTTAQRHERALQYFQEKIDSPQGATVADWDELTGGEG